MQGKIPYYAAEKDYIKIENYFEKKGIKTSITGSGRRRKSLVGDIDIVVEGEKEEIHNLMLDYEETSKCIKELIYIMKSGSEIEIITETKDLYNHTLWHSTGSKEHVKRIKEIYKEQGREINPYFQDEKEIYEKIGLKYMPAEIRHGSYEFSRGTVGELVEEKDILGAIHLHSNYSDGSESIEKLVVKSIELGYSYMGISDHSKSAYYANGLDENRLKMQFKEIDYLSEKYPNIKILKGTEADIHFDGEIDYGNEILKSFDFVIASIHKGTSMNSTEMTRRIIKALRNPYVKILGHLTGRLFLIRDSYNIDYKEILKVAKEEGKILELNANPMRLDIDYEKVMLAKDLGVKIAINPDAHNAESIKNIRYGVYEARRGFAEKKDIVNCYDYKDWI